MDATSAPIKLVLELSPDADRVAGRLHIDDLDAVAFDGYLQLMSLLEQVRRAKRDESRRAARPLLAAASRSRERTGDKTTNRDGDPSKRRGRTS